MYKLIAAALIVMGCCTLYALWSLAYTAYKLDRALYRAESECVAELVTAYNRSDIETGNGTCWLRKGS